MRSPLTPPLQSPSPGIASAQRLAIEAEDPVLELTRSDVNALSKSLGRNIITTAQLLQACATLTTIKVQGAEITLEPGLLARLKSRSAASKANFPDFVRETVIRCLHSEVGW